MTDGDIRDRDGDGINERVDENGNQKILYQMADRLDQILNPDKGSEAGLLTKGDMPLPIWLVNAESDDSLTYWKQVNPGGQRRRQRDSTGKRSGERAGIRPEGGHLGHRVCGPDLQGGGSGDRRRHGLL